MVTLADAQQAGKSAIGHDSAATLTEQISESIARSINGGFTGFFIEIFVYN
jgi:hypothetical protein